VHRSSIDRWELTYFCAGDEIPTDAAADVLGYDFRKESVVFDHPRARRVILDMPMKASVHRYFGVVHWSDGTDLEELDQRARAGDDLTDGLGTGLFCNLHDVQCRECGNNHLVAVADGGNPVVTLARLSAHTFSTTCPTCGDASFIRHAELFAGA